MQNANLYKKYTNKYTYLKLLAIFKIFRLYAMIVVVRSFF